MNTSLKNFTIVSITFNNDGINRTINSVLPLIEEGASMIIQNGGRHLNSSHSGILIKNEPDGGIYDAINRGISSVKTAYFMLLHAGDTFIGKPDDISSILFNLQRLNSNISLNSQFIGERLHSSRFWRPWMLQFGAQPPHLPTIYETETYQSKEYSLKIPIIADFDFFRSHVEWKSASWDNKIIVKMTTGGATSRGVFSILFVTKCFYTSYGFKGIAMAITRIPFKILQAIR